VTRFTAEGTAPAEARVAEDLEHITARVRAEAGEDLLAVFLLGGYARGEGAVRATASGALRGFNDYDLLLVFRAAPAREPFRRLARRLARDLEIDFVDLGLATPRDLEGAPPTLFWYELGEAHRVLWRRQGSPITPKRIPPGAIDPAEGTRLLLNRGLALLWAALRFWPEGGPGEGPSAADPAEIRFAVTASHKAVLAAGDQALLRARRYDFRQAERERRLLETPPLWSPWAPPGFMEAYRAAAAFRHRPGFPDGAGAARLWHTGRDALEAALRAAETERLGAFADWKEHARRVSRPGRAPSPRRIARALRRRLRGDPPEEGWLLARLDALLFGARGDAAWRRRGLALVRAWHP
jgi:predicted nucleotidyltransferase